MLPRSYLAFLIICFGLPLSAASVIAQGSVADYERALSLDKRTAHQIFRQQVQLQWLPGDAGGWYQNDLAEGKREWIWIDTKRGVRRQAFDHARLAKILAEKIAMELNAERLPLGIGRCITAHLTSRRVIVARKKRSAFRGAIVT